MNNNLKINQLCIHLLNKLLNKEIDFPEFLHKIESLQANQEVFNFEKAK